MRCFSHVLNVSFAAINLLHRMATIFSTRLRFLATRVLCLYGILLTFAAANTHYGHKEGLGSVSALAHLGLRWTSV